LARQLSAAQRKKLGLGGPGLADIDKLTPWRVLLACCEQRSDPSLPFTAPPAEELALRALRFALLSPLAPKVRSTRQSRRPREPTRNLLNQNSQRQPVRARSESASVPQRSRGRVHLSGPRTGWGDLARRAR